MTETMRNKDLELEQQKRIASAAIKDLEKIGDCLTCANCSAYCESNPDRCTGYKWRGVPDEENPDKVLAQYSTKTIAEDEDLRSDSEKPMGRSYLDILVELQETINSDTAIPETDRRSINDMVNFLQFKLFKYSD